MERMNVKGDIMLNSINKFCLNIEKKLERTMLICAIYMVRASWILNFKVNEKYTMNLTYKIHTCRQWGLSGILRNYGIACINYERRECLYG